MAGGILVVVEQIRGEIADITYEMLGIARKIADALHTPLYTVIFGENIASLTSRLGIADSVLLLEDPQLEMPSADVVASLLKYVMGKKGISLILIGGTNVSMGIGAILSARTKLPFVNFCKDIRLENNSVVVVSQLFGGKILADVCMPEDRGILSIYPGSFPPDAGKSERMAPIEVLGTPVEEPKVTFKRYIEPEAGDVDITKQEILVSVGRGIQNMDNIALAEDLADALGGVVSASRPVVDQGWLPLSRQVGKSGMIVNPKLYLALGISGAPEHVEGMKGSELIISINTDHGAPIFATSHYGVCGDLLDIMPLLTEEIKKRKGGR